MTIITISATATIASTRSKSNGRSNGSNNKSSNINRRSVFVEVSVIAIIVVAVVAIVHGSIPLLLLLLSAHERKPERGKKEENKEKQ